MSDYRTTVRWERGDQNFLDNKYSRGHTWLFDSGAQIAASSSPHVVPVPMSVEENIDPEEAFEELEDMHHQSHENCYIANSVTTEIETLLG